MNHTKDRKDPYKNAGVDIHLGDSLVDWLQSTDQNSSPNGSSSLGEIVSGIGGFASLFRPRFGAMKDPLLVAGTDGVGTKVLLGMEHGHLEGLGIDLVAMCANDLFTLGARALFFLDYYATGELRRDQFQAVLTGIRKGLAMCDVGDAARPALMGGETAEMPGLYKKGHFDLAGFLVGVVDGARMLGPHRVKSGDVLVAFPSTGFHSNGYSLVRHWLKDGPDETSESIAQLMTPTKIYGEIHRILKDTDHQAIHAMAHITGGGISGNLPRVIPAGLDCVIERSAVPTPAWMRDFILRHTESIFDVEPVFNMGCGMIAAVDPTQRESLFAAARDLHPVELGVVQGGQGEAKVVYR